MSPKKHGRDFFTILDREEYVWAMKTSAYEEKRLEEEELERARDGTRRSVKESYLKSSQVNKTTIVASFVPDQIIMNVDDYEIKTFEVCLLVGDVSGFTELCESYSKPGSGGPSKLTDVLNSFIGAMVQEIMSYGGDVIKFSGDAFLAMWKCGDKSAMRDYIQEAINCALVIQRSHNNLVTDVGIALRIKLAISAGTLLFSLIGDSKLSHYIEVGQPILDTKEILELCDAGDIIISEKAWAFVDCSAYQSEEFSQGKYIKVFGVGATWRQVEKFLTQTRFAPNAKLTNSTESIASTTESMLKRKRSSEFALRPLVNIIATGSENIYESLKKFITTPVMQRIELNEPLEYLTELRQITVIMINILPHTMPFDSLIGLVKKVYRIITAHSQRFNGCINKVSCFDKDLMCVLIFGLRGLKQELECRNALRCASFIHSGIRILPKVKNVSIGVSTGKAYCGVFGHTLRREYTVIGLTVNKAARLMVAYPGKVTCCNETFINCKMRENYFEQQKFVSLKGIKCPGPVYEFKYTEQSVVQPLNVSEYPILGRTEEVTLYTKLLDNFMRSCKEDTQSKKACKKMIVIEAEAKSGKTRLVEEFIYVTPIHIPIRTIFAENPAHEPYKVLKQIFFSGMGITLKTPEETRHDIFEYFFTNYLKPDLLCSLNDMFDINYPISSVYENLSEEERLTAVGEALIYLAPIVFTTPSILIIERIMGMDDLTWQLYPHLLRICNIFTIASMRPSRKCKLETRQWIFTSAYVHVLKLKKISKLYHGALACQMMDIGAIPPDLENIIQSRSNGNAGWIKNLLLCLQQAQMIKIQSMSYDEINRRGLVVPPLYMMKRLDHKQLEVWKRIMDEKSEKKIVVSSDPWCKFVDSCRDRYTDVRIRKEIERMFAYDKNVKACVLIPGFEEFTKHGEQSNEIVIIKNFDSLFYIEQLIVKCGSVLGWQFSRSILDYIVGYDYGKREKSMAIQKLFERQIFGCSRGDFTEAGEYVVIRTREKIDYENPPVECRCLGVNIPGCCKDLPKYASCGYLHFISNDFLQATYNLLPEAQKIDFHQRAAKYLEKNARKCRSCGNGFFEEFTGRKEKSLKFAKKLKKGSFLRMSYEDDFLSRSIHSDNESFLFGSQGQSTDLKSEFVSEAKVSMAMGVFNRTKLYHLKERISLTRTFSIFDFSYCECELILNFIYGEVSRHYKVAGQFDLMLKSMLAYAKSCMILHNTAEAYITLETADNHLKNHGIAPEEPQWKLYLLQGNVYTLRGRALLQTNQTEEAKICLFKALEKYGAPFPKSNFRKFLKYHSVKLKHKLSLYFFPDSLVKPLKLYEAAYFNDIAQCLYLLTAVFHNKRQLHEEELAATWALHCALKADYDFVMICKCFKNMLYVAQRNCNVYHCLALEVHALRYCHKKTANIELDDLKHVADMYHAIRRYRSIRSEMEKSIHIGYITLRLAASVNFITLILKVLPRLVFSLMIKSYLQEACALLNEMDYYSNESDCNSFQSGRLSFHIACLRFHIETGYTFISYEEVEKFVNAENSQSTFEKNPVRAIELVSLMWLWNCRNNRWEYASKWKHYIQTYTEDLIKNHYHIPYCIMYILEGYLLSLVHTINNQGIASYDALVNFLNKLFKKLVYFTKFSRLVLPRLKRFQAYYEYINGREEKALDLLEDDLILAAKYENALELMHINHTKLAWTNQLPRNARDAWVAHCDFDHLLDYRLIDENEHTILSFTLPKPIFD